MRHLRDLRREVDLRIRLRRCGDKGEGGARKRFRVDQEADRQDRTATNPSSGGTQGALTPSQRLRPLCGSEFPSGNNSAPGRKNHGGSDRSQETPTERPDNPFRPVLNAHRKAGSSSGQARAQALRLAAPGDCLPLSEGDRGVVARRPVAKSVLSAVTFGTSRCPGSQPFCELLAPTEHGIRSEPLASRHMSALLPLRTRSQRQPKPSSSKVTSPLLPIEKSPLPNRSSSTTSPAAGSSENDAVRGRFPIL